MLIHKGILKPVRSDLPQPSLGVGTFKSTLEARLLATKGDCHWWEESGFFVLMFLVGPSFLRAKSLAAIVLVFRLITADDFGCSVVCSRSDGLAGYPSSTPLTSNLAAWWPVPAALLPEPLLATSPVCYLFPNL